MKKDSFGQYIMYHKGYLFGLLPMVAVFISYGWVQKFFIGLSVAIILAVYFGFKKWKRNQ